MSVRVSIVDGAIDPEAHGSGRDLSGGCGAELRFEGIVRGLEDGMPIQALDYTAYEPMASRVLSDLAQRMLTAHGIGEIHIVHSRGRVRVGECSMLITIRSARRKAALTAMDDLIDHIKTDVPIWKKPAF